MVNFFPNLICFVKWRFLIFSFGFVSKETIQNNLKERSINSFLAVGTFKI